jgi:hypothetical protein
VKQLEWKNDREFTLDGVEFMCSPDDFSRRTDGNRLVLLKDRATLDNYAEAFAGAPLPRNVLEFGIFQGGSPALFTLWFDVEKFVGLDISAPIEDFDAFCRRPAFRDRIRAYYGTSQTDRDAVRRIVQQEFSGSPLDLIIDDASHLYRASRASFEIAFPLLRPGGSYVIEDWGWAHWQGFDLHAGKTALSMLIMELTMACTARRDVINEVRVFPSFVQVKKALTAPYLADMELSSLYTKRDIELVGTEEQNLGGVARLIGKRLLKNATKGLRRRRR